MPDLSGASIEELMNIRVTTVAKKEESLATAAAAVYVITREDIRTSGAESLPEVLRLAPGVEVAQISSSVWAISIRGFNSRFANKLLVLIDGRTVYSPTFSGVFWNEQMPPLPEIERIEVIRGPGATLWGTNAVNGVINIITRSSAETRGCEIEVGSGSYETLLAYTRCGAAAGNDGNFRLYVQHQRWADLSVGGVSAKDGWHSTRGGFRSDWKLGASDFLTVQGDATGGDPSYGTWFSAIPPPYPGYDSFSGGNLLARWRRVISDHSEFSIQAYYDSALEKFPSIIDLRSSTFNVDLQHNFRIGRSHDFVWGATFRNIREQTAGSAYIQLVPPDRTVRIFSGFVQDDISLRKGKVHLIAGSKFEGNGLSGVDVQPTLRFLFVPSARQAIWTAITRGMRSPSIFENSVRAFLPGIVDPDIALLIGNPRGRSEELVAYEAGYRAQFTPKFSLDVASFYYQYHHLSRVGPAPIIPPGPGIVPLTEYYDQNGHSYGLEVSAAYAPVKWWKITGSYSWLHEVFRAVPAQSTWTLTENPAHRFQVHSLMSLPHQLELDAHIYFVSTQPNLMIPSFTRTDLRFAWRPNKHWEWSLAGQNLFDGSHPEFLSSGSGAPLDIGRSVFGKVKLVF